MGVWGEALEKLTLVYRKLIGGGREDSLIGTICILQERHAELERQVQKFVEFRKVAEEATHEINNGRVLFSLCMDQIDRSFEECHRLSELVNLLVDKNSIGNLLSGKIELIEQSARESAEFHKNSARALVEIQFLRNNGKKGGSDMSIEQNKYDEEKVKIIAEWGGYLFIPGSNATMAVDVYVKEGVW